MLPHEDLAPWYEQAVWLYVCRTWREDEPDLEAMRIHDRFGVTSWPHLFLIHPRDDRVLVRAGRTADALGRAFRTAAAAVEPLPEDEIEPALADLRATHERVVALETLGRGATAERGREALAWIADPDPLVRHRALLVVKRLFLPELAEHAESLLIEGNDAIRFELLDWIELYKVPNLTPLLVRIFTEAGGALPSGNPNVLRGRAARCLAVCGDARAIDTLAPIARAADARNATTRTVVEALGAIGSRGDDGVRSAVVEILSQAWPAVQAPAANGKPTVLGRYALRLAEAVTKALAQALGTPGGESAAPDLPAGWSAEERKTYVEDVTVWIRAATRR